MLINFWISLKESKYFRSEESLQSHSESSLTFTTWLLRADRVCIFSMRSLNYSNIFSWDQSERFSHTFTNIRLLIFFITMYVLFLCLKVQYTLKIRMNVCFAMNCIVLTSVRSQKVSDLMQIIRVRMKTELNHFWK